MAEEDKQRAQATKEPFLNWEKWKATLKVLVSNVRKNPDTRWQDTDEGIDLMTQLHVELSEIGDGYDALMFTLVMQELSDYYQELLDLFSESDKLRREKEKLERTGLSIKAILEAHSFSRDPQKK
jgi:uncharacterized coiled-coil DUF342 family protein